MGPAERIRAYFDSCTRGSVADIAGHFTDGAVIYDTNHRPVRSAAGIGMFWSKVRERWQGATWTVDTVVSEGDAAAIEWTMSGLDGDRPFAVRGSEHYRLVDGFIDEIRQYWTFDPDHPGSELVEFPYPDDPPSR